MATVTDAEEHEVALLDTRAAIALVAEAKRVGGRSVAIVTFDVRLAQEARSLGFAVVGA